jgi:hypothetical protein
VAERLYDLVMAGLFWAFVPCGVCGKDCFAMLDIGCGRTGGSCPGLKRSRLAGGRQYRGEDFVPIHHEGLEVDLPDFDLLLPPFGLREVASTGDCMTREAMAAFACARAADDMLLLIRSFCLASSASS